MTTLAAHPRIEQDPAVMGGKPCIAGTRIPVDLLLRKLAAGETREQLLGDYPSLTASDLDAALNYAPPLPPASASWRLNKLRILADACVGASLVQALREHGHDVVYAAEGPPRVPDETILAAALRDDRIVLTEDHDFGALALRDRQMTLGVVLVELHGLSTALKIARVTDVLGAAHADLVGAFTVIEPGRVRRRPILPES